MMTSETYRGVVRGGMVVFLEPAKPLTDGTEVLVTPVAAGPGTPAAVLAAMQASPQVPVEWVDELDQVIAAGRRPPGRNDPFGEADGPQEAR
jgi:hypothetical protein